MNKFLVLAVTFGFILWLLPLGYLIKPAQEKVACDGQRAICMCHAFIPKASAHAMETGVGLFAGAPAHRDNSAGGSNYFISAKAPLGSPLFSGLLFNSQHFSYTNPFLASLEYVPKV